MYHARTVLDCYIIARNHAESVAFERFEPGNQLLVAHSHEFAALDFAGQHFVGNLVGEPRSHQGFRQNVSGFFSGVGILRLDLYIVDVGPHTERRIGREGPGGGSPCQEIEVLLPFDFELGSHGGVAHVAVAAGLIEFMRTQARSVGGRIGLDGVSLVKKPLVVDLLEKIPQSLYVTVVIGYVGVVHVNPVTDSFGHRHPFAGVLHYLGAATAVVLLYGNLFADIRLGNAEFLFNPEFHGQSVGVPARLAAYAEPRLGLIAADGVLDRARHNVMDARHAVGRRGTLEEYEFGSALPKFNRSFERVIPAPPLQLFGGDAHQIKALVLFECHNILPIFASRKC